MAKERKKGEKYIIVHVEGGLGKNILATAMISALKKHYKDYLIVVVSAWYAPYYYNSDIFRVYTFGQMAYFYDDYIYDDTKIMRIDPYHTEDHIQQRKHLIKTWCDLYEIPYNGELPKLYINPREIELVKDKIKPTGKPIMIIHSHGGGGQQYSKKSWSRDIPIEIAQSIVNFYSKHYRILHIRLQNQPALENVEMLDLPQRELFAALTLSKKRLLIDSFSQHAAAALGLPSTVCWIGNKPEVFGYDIHDNILPNANKTQDLGKFKYMDNYDLSGQIQEFPYDTVNLFDVNVISNSLKKQK